MKILHINKSDSSGGAAVAAVRLLKAQRGQGMDAQMLTLESMAEDEDIVPLLSSRWQETGKMLRFLAEIYSFSPKEKGRQHRFAFSPARFGFDISRHPLVVQADVLHLHWINQGFVSLTGLQQLLNLNKPIVWTLHDMWPFTGGCHYPGECSRFVSGCGHCPFLKRAGENDISARQHAIKKKIYNNARMAFVGCSQWMADQAARSAVVQPDSGHIVKSIFNPIDTILFAPGPREDARQAFQLPAHKKLVLVGAANVNDTRKGIHHLAGALQHLTKIEPSLLKDMEVVVFGKNAHQILSEMPFRVHPVAFVKTQPQMAQLYRAADVFVLPSMQDNLPNTVMESLACGTPVAAFEVGGVPEMIEHQQRGTLAPPGDEATLAQGIHFLLTAPGIDERRVNARRFVENHCTPQIIARQYQALYQSLI